MCSMESSLHDVSIETSVKKTTRKRKSSSNINGSKKPVVSSKKPKKIIEENKDKSAANKSNEVLSDNPTLPDSTSAWNEAELLTNIEKVPKPIAQNFIKLLAEGCTLPFIARYRKSAVGYLLPDRLHEIYQSYQNICALKKKVKSVIEALKKSKKLTPEIEKCIHNVQNLSELDLIYAPLKTHSLSLAERARKLGLEETAVKALNGEYINLHSLCTSDEELSSVDKVDVHVTHIIADIIYKDARVLEQMRTLKEETRFTLQSSRSKSSAKSKDKSDENKKLDTKTDPETYKLYFEWQCPVQFVKPHQMLALNRGEDEKVLTVKVVVPDWYYHKLERFCSSLWKSHFWVKKGLTDAFNRLIKPWLSRQVRSDLTNIAQREAVKTFTNNLEIYLLTEPIKNKRIAGLDPGFKAGCKVGVIDVDGQKLDVCTLYPDLKRINHTDPASQQLKKIIEKNKVELIGLGNGTACRETETWLKSHKISTDVPVVIVPEQGASIYSISKEASKEHPNMDPNLISALSIARRVLNPLGELIKVDPKNLGVGMYQHDVPPKMLESALDCVVEKVVSLVGVDVNTATHALLRRISGLNDSRAKKILDYRNTKGGLNSRDEILKVSGIGKITYQQCAGFLKVIGGKEPLDATIIHPESYAVAKKLAKKIGVNLKEFSKPDFPEKVESKTSSINMVELSKELSAEVCDLELIINAFKQKNCEDNLISFSKPVYSISAQSIEELRDGMSLIGVVRNVVPFGCFVDCGVKDSGLIHTSNIGANRMPKLGDRVAVTVLGVPKPKKFQLRLDKIID